MTNNGMVARSTRFTLVGAVCAVLYNIILIFGNKLGGSYIGLSLLAFVVVTPIGYLLHARLTFGIQRSWRDFGRFTSGVAASFPIYLVLMMVLCSGLRLPMLIAAPTATIAMYVWNYASTHWALRSWMPFGGDRTPSRSGNHK